MATWSGGRLVMLAPLPDPQLCNWHRHVKLEAPTLVSTDARTVDVRGSRFFLSNRRQGHSHVLSFIVEQHPSHPTRPFPIPSHIECSHPSRPGCQGPHSTMCGPVGGTHTIRRRFDDGRGRFDDGRTRTDAPVPHQCPRTIDLTVVTTGSRQLRHSSCRSARCNGVGLQ